MNKKNEKYENAKLDFEKISQMYSLAEENDKFLFEYAHLIF